MWFVFHFKILSDDLFTQIYILQLMFIKETYDERLKQEVPANRFRREYIYAHSKATRFLLWDPSKTKKSITIKNNNFFRKMMFHSKLK